MKGRFWLLIAFALLLIAPINFGVKEGKVLNVTNRLNDRSQIDWIAMVDVKTRRGILFGALGFTQSDVRFYNLSPVMLETYAPGTMLTAAQISNMSEHKNK